MLNPFKLGQDYSREKEIHAHFGGNTRQGSIQRSPKFPVIMLFSGEYGDQEWYRDHSPDGEEYYKFCGSGQPGNMTLSKHNSILSHIKEDAALLLFRSSGPGQKYKYLGEYYCWKYEYEPSNVDPVKWPNILVFYLGPFSQKNFTSNLEELLSKTKSLRGKNWVKPPLGQPSPQQTTKAGNGGYKRDPETRAYVLDRAKGACEHCKLPAPFKDSDDLPFLEAHHVIPLSCSGPDTWYNLVALCPNCHREMHHGGERAIKSELLEKYLLQLRRQLQ